MSFHPYCHGQLLFHGGGTEMSGLVPMQSPPYFLFMLPDQSPLFGPGKASVSDSCTECYLRKVSLIGIYNINM